MLTSEIVVQSPPYFVWAYFTRPLNWSAWAKSDLLTAHWKVGGRLNFEKNVMATIDAIAEGKNVTFGDSWSEETWEFTATPEGHTLVRVTERPRAIKYSDGGAGALAKTRAELARFKAAIEKKDDEPTAAPATDDADDSRVATP